MKNYTKKNKISLLIISLVLPVVALLISYDMIKNSFQKYSKDITVFVKDVNGLDIRKSHIKYRGIDIGDIVSINPDKDDITRFKLEVKIYKDYAYLIKQGTIFWKVSANISLDKTENLDTILKGNYIQISPPSFDIKILKTLKNQDIFVAGFKKKNSIGTTIDLISAQTNPKVGDGVYFQDIKIGEVLKNFLQNNISHTSVLIYEKYQHIISQNCYFYIKPPVDIDLKFDSIDVIVEPINTILKGGLHIVKDSTIQDINNKKIYNSQAELYKTEKFYFSFDIVGDMAKNSETIYYKSIKIGFIKSQRLKNQDKISTAHIENRYKYLINSHTKFYKINNIQASLGLDGFKLKVPDIKEIATGGISFVYRDSTNKKYKKSYKLYKSLDDIKTKQNSYNYFDITLSANNLLNIKTSSSLFYKNFKIGSIKTINLNNNKINIKIKVQNKFKKYFGKNSKIYSEGLKVGLDGVQNLSSAVLGDKLHLVSSVGGFKDSFKLHQINPNKYIYKDGFRVKLYHKNSKSISIGTPLFYRYKQIGAVQDISFYKSGVMFDIFIENRYKSYLKNDSSFKRNSTIDMKFSIFNSQIKIGTLKDIFAGGLSIHDGKSSKNAKQGQIYNLIVDK